MYECKCISICREREREIDLFHKNGQSGIMEMLRKERETNESRDCSSISIPLFNYGLK